MANDILINSEIMKRGYDFSVVPLNREVLRLGGDFAVKTLLGDLQVVGKVIGVILLKKPRLTYFCIAQTRWGLWRECVLIWLARFMGTKCLVQLRGGNFRNILEHQIPHPWEKKVIKRTLQWLNGVIVLDSSLAWNFLGLVPPERIHVLANGIPQSCIPPGRVDVAMGERQESRKLRVTYLSNLLPGKGYLTFLEAAGVLQQRSQAQNFVFNLAGAAPGPSVVQEVEEFVRHHDLQDSVRVVGKVLDGEKWDLLLNSDVFVFPPYLPEGQPWSIIEAMAAGLPVISTNKGCIPSMVKEGLNGYIVAENQATAIAEKLVLLQQNPELRLAMSRASRERYCSHYTGERFVQGFADILAKVMAEG
ncbi:MAG: glycosyltransferase [Desulfobaccales bacterium]